LPEKTAFDDQMMIKSSLRPFCRHGTAVFRGFDG